MIGITPFLLIGIGGGSLAVIDGLNRVRGTGAPVLAVLQVIVGGSFLASLLLTGFLDGSHVLAGATLAVSILQLLLRGSNRATEVAVTIVASAATGGWLALAEHWLVVPGIN